MRNKKWHEAPGLANFYDTAGRRFERARKALGLSAGQLGARCGLSGQRIYAIECGYSRVRLREAMLLCGELGVKVDTLWGVA